MNKIINYISSDGTYTTFENCNYIQIELFGSHAIENNSIMLISKNKFNYVINFKWYLGKNNYPVAYNSIDNQIKFGRGITLHKLLFPNLSKGLVVDHINRNKLDNRNENLRICTAKENSYNKTKSVNSLNKYKGVSKSSNGMFKASITKDGKKIEINDIPDEKLAAQTYNLMSEELFGSFACKNNV